ncbi:MAG TPA: aminotransferase class III-fold pyridoxal phosphate-dependent enzyme, partial [Gemmatimonadales bacterium]
MSDGGLRDRIAIVGMAVRFPGATTLDAFWRNLREGIESIRSFNPDELQAAGVDPAVLADPAYVNAGGAPDGVAMFDAGFFGYTPREAAVMDPQHRLLLECASNALDHAGYDPERYEGRIGVYGGVGRNTYFLNNVFAHRELLDQLGAYQTAILTEKDYPATRVAYKLNLRGPAVNVVNACSTSGVAVHLACQSLLTGECDMALVAGARVKVPVEAGYYYEEGGIASPDGHCRPFDAKAAGTVIASGAAALLVKPLEDALRDGDTVHAVILGTAINNDGASKVSFTAPSVRGQSEVVADALAVAGVSPDSIGYVEAHGTATAVGDPIEVLALTRAFRRATDRVGFCSIGSVKSNIGHLDAAAGLAGIIKTALALRHREIPASLHFTVPNPEIDFASSPFFVNDRLSPWPEGPAGVRRAGVSSFGLGGTNAHIVLEEAPSVPAIEREESERLVILSARDEAALARSVTNLVAHIEAHPDESLAHTAHTLQVGRRRMAHRLALVVRSNTDAVACLRDAQTSMRGTSGDVDRTVAFMFPGGGAQHPGMVHDLYETQPVFRHHLEQCLGMVPHVAQDVRRLIRRPGDDDAARALSDARFALPALFATEYALARQWMEWGVAPSAMIGHSMGEYVAACLAGVMRLDDAMALVAKRAELLAKAERGAMLSVPLGPDAIRRLLGDSVSVAAVNRPALSVIAGTSVAIHHAERTLAAEGVDTAPLHIEVAAHSAQLDPLLDEFRAFASGIAFSVPTVPYLSNLTGTWVPMDAAPTADYWVDHLRHTVLFSDGLEQLFADSTRVLLEVGPGQTLTTFARQHPARPAECVAVASLPHPKETVSDATACRSAIGRLWLHGVAIDWGAVDPVETARRVPLPSYPFARARHWIDPATPTPARPAGPAVRLDAVTALAAPALREAAATPTASRSARLTNEICRTMAEISGLPLDAIDPAATFLELGFESLSLTQASAAIGRRFGVTVSFRQLIERWSSPRMLAAHLDEVLPADARLASAEVTGVARPEPAPLADQTPSAAPLPVDAPVASFGPWRPLGGDPASTLSERQDTHVRMLTERYNAKTAASKAFAQRHRSHLADPRSVAGFRLAWKDLVYPIVVERSEGSRVWDVDGNEYIDVVMGFGVNLFGHAPAFVRDALRVQLEKGFEIGPQSPIAGEVARAICELTGMERAAFCNTGSEAVLAAIRMARTVTGRDRIVTFSGAYHGIFDEVLVRGMGSGAARRALPIAPGIPASKVGHVLVLDYDDPASLVTIEREAESIAAVLVEPVQSRRPELQPAEFLRALREVTSRHDIPLVFDEMITGFRAHPRGAQGWFDVRADLATYGKVIGGGMPIGVVAGRARYMDALDGGHWQYGDDSVPEAGITWFAGTFVRHPLALAAARASLTHLIERGPQLQQDLNARTTAVAARLNAFCREHRAPVTLHHFSSFMLIALEHQREYAGLLFAHLRDRRIHALENRCVFFSTAHSDADLDQFAEAFEDSIIEMQRGGFLAGGMEVVTPPSAAIAERPLTDAQTEVWLATQMGEDASCAFNLAFALDVNGRIDQPAIRAAVHGLVERHEALRTTIAPDGSVQRVAHSMDVSLRIEDTGALDPIAQQARLAEVERQEAETAFDLIDGPLVRFRLLVRGDEGAHLIVTVHHVVCDGWSCGVLLRDLAELYQRAVRGGPALAPATSFQAFVVAAAGAEARAARERAAAYWRAQFATVPPALELPTDVPRPSRKSYRARRVGVTLGPDVATGLKRAGARQGCTLFATLLAAVHAFLHRLTGQDDLVTGVLAAGQPASGMTSVVGHCANLLPMRATVRGDEPFDALLRATRGRVLDAFENQQYTLGALLRDLDVRRDASRLPLLSMIFNVDPTPPRLAFDELAVTVRAIPKRFENFDLFVNAVDLGGDIRLECTFNTDLFRDETIERWLATFRTFAEAIGRTPDRAVAHLPLLTERERRQVVVEWNETERLEADGATMHGMVEAQAART